MGRWLILILLVLPTSAAATCWVDIPFGSFHSDRQGEYNERNTGLGIDCRVSRQWKLDVVGGFYENSQYVETRYAGVDWMPLQFGNVELGLREVKATGYSEHAAWTPFPIPVAKIRSREKGYGLGVMFVPPVSSSRWVMGFWAQIAF